MTKAKGLASIVVDNMCRLFPVDRERYELVDLLTEWHQHSRYGMPLPAQMATDEGTFIAFIEGTHETVMHIARAWEMTGYQELRSGSLWKARAEMAREIWTSEACNPYIADPPQPEDGFAHIVWSLWHYLIVKLQREVEYVNGNAG